MHAVPLLLSTPAARVPQDVLGCLSSVRLVGDLLEASASAGALYPVLMPPLGRLLGAEDPLLRGAACTVCDGDDGDDGF